MSAEDDGERGGSRSAREPDDRITSPGGSAAIAFEVRGDVLVARVHGHFDRETDEWVDRTVAARCRRGALGRVLVDFRGVEGMAKPAESYRAGSSLEARGFSRGIRLAILDLSEFRAANDLYRLVARNRGFDVRHFYEENEALAWLER